MPFARENTVPERLVAVPNSRAVLWIYHVPAWVLMPAATIVCCAAAAGGLALTRWRLARNELITHNDVAGPILSTIGTILAVLMSFMVLGVWQEYDGAAQDVAVEAGTLSDLHHLADGFPNPFRDQLKAKIDRYIELVINVEWPEMRTGGESQGAHDTAYQIESLIASFKPATSAQSTLQSSAVSLTQRFLDARRQRIHDNEQSIPVWLWAAMLFIGFVTIAFSYYFRVDRPHAQYTMVIALTCVIALTFTVMAELDLPFRGDVGISPISFQRAFNTIHNIGLQR